MIQFQSQSQIDLKKYDSCVQRDQSSLPYAHSWYLNAVCEQWDCLVLDDYQAVWPLPFRKKAGLKYYFRPFGIQQLGIYSRAALNDEIIAAFISEMARQVRFADIYLNEGQTLLSSSKTDWVLQEQRNQKLSISGSYQGIYENFSQNLKRKLKKTAKANLELFEHDGPQVILDLFKEHKGQELKLNPTFYRDIKQLLFLLMHKGLAKVYTVYGGPNQLLAGAVFIHYNKRSIFLFSANSPLGKELNAMAYLINEYLIYHSGKFDYLDFEGSNLEGLGRFYSSFGADDYSYSRLYLNRLPWPLNRYRK